MGHISSQNIILANDDFYRFNIDKIIRGDESEEPSSELLSPTNEDAMPENRRARLNIDVAKERRFKKRKAAL